jgi:type I site-specific restriction-modification system R (restriction) subunit
MNWLNLRPVSAEVELKLKERIQNFIEENTANDGGNDHLSVKKLIQDLYLIVKLGADSKHSKILIDRISELAASWDSEEPELAHIQKYLNRLFSDRKELASEYIDRSINLKIESDNALSKQTKSDTAKNNAHLKNLETNQVKEAALNYFNKNSHKFKTKKEAARELELMFPPIKYSTYYRSLRIKKP